MNSFFREETMEMDLHGIIFIITFFSSFWMHTVLGDKDACTNWTLLGGVDFYEGMVTVSYNGTTVNICAVSFNDNAQRMVCRAIMHTNVKESAKANAETYSDNLYNVKKEGRAISYSRCLDTATNDSSTIELNCKPASLCCEVTKWGLCTKDWKYYRNEAEVFTNPKNPTDSSRHLTFDELIDYNFTGIKTFKKSWTRSFLQEVERCPTSNSSDKVYNGPVKNCKNRCAVTEDLSFVFLHVENKTCCLENSSSLYLESDNCTVSVLSVLHVNSTSNVSCCIAAEVENASLYVSIEDCKLFFQPFRVPLNEDNTRKVTRRHYESKTTVPPTTSSATLHTQTAAGIHEVIMAISICGPLLLLMIILFTVYILWKIKQSESKREQQRPNSVINRTYNLEEPRHSYLDDEEYTLITDMEVEHGSADSYKPPVPARGDSKTGTKPEKSAQQVIILGEYCTPSDQLRVGYKISQTSDYCMKTYDDPTRHKSTTSTENYSKREGIENCSCENKEEQLHKRNSNTDSLGRSSRNSEIWTAANTLVTTDLNRDTNGESSNTDFKHEKIREEAGDINSTIQACQKDKSENHIVTLIKQEHMKADGHFEIFTGLKSKETGTEVNTSKTDSDDSDYEDSSTLGEMFQTTNSSKPVLEDHVCLDCLKPEHLTKLGIKLISEEMYEKQNNLQRSRSDPPPQYCYCNTKSVDEEHGSNTHKTQSEVQTETVPSEHDTITAFKVLRNKNRSTCTRCSVCHTVYERLGIESRNAWTNCTDNVYDKFGDFKHFKHRQQIGGKRINST